MAVVMLVLLCTILGSIAIASRSSSGLLAARSQSSNREARDVAESGATEIISELNKEQNRKLLILPVANWNAAAVNPCSSINNTGTSVSPVPTPTNKALNLSANWTDLTSGDTTRQYRLDTASATTTARAALSGSPSSNQLQGTEKTLFRLTVSGRIRDAAGNLISTATITREYEVVPKCCKRSFGRNSTSATIYGDDTRTCFAGASGGLGIVVGINGGSLTTSKNAFDMTDQNGLPITRVLCARTTGTSACNNGTLRLGSSISVVPTTFSTPFPSYPGTITTARNLNTETRSYIRINTSSSPAIVEQCTLSGSTLSSCTNISSGSSRPCEIVSGQAWCRLTFIDSKNTVTTFDSTNGKINLYYTGNGSGGGNSQYIDLGGSGAISHVNCASSSNSSVACGTAAPLAEVENLNVFISGTGTFQLRGTSSTLAINIFNPNGITNMRGGGSANPNFIGRIWTHDLEVNGSVNMQVPVSNPTQFCTTISDCPTQAGGSPSTDWVARSITQSSNF